MISNETNVFQSTTEETISSTKSFNSTLESCIHPQIDIFDPEIMKFYPKLPKCLNKEKHNAILKDGKLLNTIPSKYNCSGRFVVLRTKYQMN